MKNCFGRYMVAAFAAGIACAVVGAPMRSTVGKVSATPVIDGVEDACYGDSMPIEGFTYPGAMTPSRRSTCRSIR